ncbi:DUF1330 domain-containing protein [Rubrobacter calidifluminis]|uniref:DUF1330 domain-containing protein n=1 Tax=Rubrobacter calidifluminis TaxID=1392640 RepID=UPI00236143AA|nr:DUF1330 domain-containing protein [Rubrobacter calidifluminis]
MSFYALNLFDLADNDLYLRYSRRSVAAVEKQGGKVVALGKLDGGLDGSDVRPRRVMILVEWPSKEAFQAFLDDPENEDLHPLREGGTENYLWWTYEKLDDLRPVFREARSAGEER